MKSKINLGIRIESARKRERKSFENRLMRTKDNIYFCRLNFIHSFIRLINRNYLCWQLSLVSWKILPREHLVMASLCLCEWMNVSERIFIEPNDLTSNWFGNICCIEHVNTLCIKSNFTTIKCYHVSGWLQCILMMFWQLSTRKAKNRACNSNSAESPNIIPKENEKWFGNILLGIDTTHESISATV